MCNQESKINVFGSKLVTCSENPVTGFYRDGYCKLFINDPGEHTVCAELTDKFLQFSKLNGNDLSTPRPEFDFVGLKQGDRWCLCANRWLEALEYNMAPKIYLEATHISILEKINFKNIRKFAIELENLN
tara:strand:- start:605 stop:994 length:390 start_codon:yes stop_codon:yes gene_type:complete